MVYFLEEMRYKFFLLFDKGIQVDKPIDGLFPRGNEVLVISLFDKEWSPVFIFKKIIERFLFFMSLKEPIPIIVILTTRIDTYNRKVFRFVFEKNQSSLFMKIHYVFHLKKVKN